MTHIMWLTNLPPDIQEAILFLPRVESGLDTVKEADVRRIARVMDWCEQWIFGKTWWICPHNLDSRDCRRCLRSNEIGRRRKSIRWV
ncbi:MAG: hypothetical protein CMM07_15895 [Rhodopirellula sp.]|nr:hypothetical protein [Rhodopirellula sp.]